MNYKDLGIIIGLEIHQQVDGHKLFCKCPCVIKDDAPDFKIKRNLRLTASETGTFDQAAMYELQKGKYFIYEGYNDTNCLVELDENPPEEVNKTALQIALQVAMLTNATPIDQIQFMRKIVIDGSNVSGFQRTALVAVNGYIETTEGKVSITSVCLEEESAKKIEDTEKYRKYNISRLCIPLIEIATGPDIHSPQQAKEAAEKIGMILRSIQGIRRGLGTIRQDVNLSIKGGSRVEIKGFQELKSIPKVIEYEIERQYSLLKSGNKLKPEVRKAEANLTTTFLRPMPGASRMYPETDVPTIKITKELLKTIKKPELKADKVEKIQETFGISAELAKEILDNNIQLEEYVTKYRNIDAQLTARILVELPKELKTRLNLDSNKLTEDNYHAVLLLIDQNKVPKSAAIDCLADLIKYGKIEIENYKVVNEKELEEKIKEIIKNNPNAPFSGLMGEAMKQLKGKADGKKVSEIINRLKK